MTIKKFYSTSPRIETSSVSKLKCHFETFFDSVFLHLSYFDDSSNVRSLAFEKYVRGISDHSMADAGCTNSTVTFSIMPFRVMPHSIMDLIVTLSKNDIWQKH